MPELAEGLGSEPLILGQEPPGQHHKDCYCTKNHTSLRPHYAVRKLKKHTYSTMDLLTKLKVSAVTGK
jgi:hypothetical protein